MRERFEPRQTDETTGALDGVHQPENASENLGVVRLLLEANKFGIDDVETFARLGQKFLEQIFHGGRAYPNGGPGRSSPGPRCEAEYRFARVKID